MTDRTILWRRLDRPGHEFARLSFGGAQNVLSGSAVFLHDGEPCRLDYAVTCDAGWKTLSGRVEGWVAGKAVSIEISVDPDGRWRANGRECPAVEGCTDLDLNFSPSTNLLPIRRLALEIGQEARVRAAWLRFPSFALEPLEQVYRRTDVTAYHYDSAGGSFVAQLEVDRDGLVTFYPGLCRAEGAG